MSGAWRSNENRFSEREAELLAHLTEDDAFEERITDYVPVLQRRVRRQRELRNAGWLPSRKALVPWTDTHAEVATRYSVALPSEVALVGLELFVAPDLALYLNGLGGFATAKPEEDRALAYLTARGVAGMHAALAAWRLADAFTSGERFRILQQMITAYEEESR